PSALWSRPPPKKSSPSSFRLAVRRPLPNGRKPCARSSRNTRRHTITTFCWWNKKSIWKYLAGLRTVGRFQRFVYRQNRNQPHGSRDVIDRFALARFDRRSTGTSPGARRTLRCAAFRRHHHVVGLTLGDHPGFPVHRARQRSLSATHDHFIPAHHGHLSDRRAAGVGTHYRSENVQCKSIFS